MSKAYIINTGIITSIGHNTAANLYSLLQKRHGISCPEILQTSLHLPVGEIKIRNEDLAMQCNIGKALPRTALLSQIAAREALQPFTDKIKNLRVAFISGNTVGGMDLTENFYQQYKANGFTADLEQVRYHECGAITELVADNLGLNCFTATISTACSSSANTIMLGAQLLETGQYDLVLTGGADALSKFTLNGFNSLMILDKEPSQPFDENRRGLNLGEGAAYLLLANEKTAALLNVRPIAYVSGYANANDAHHQTASSPEGTGNKLAMQNALKQAGIRPEQVDYINLHGTGTGNNDSSEGIAVQDVFHSNVPYASSTKAFTGHTLGAAGAVEAVYSYLAIREQITLPHLRLQTPMQSLSWQPCTELIQTKIENVLSNSFGFGGNCSALVMSKL